MTKSRLLSTGLLLPIVMVAMNLTGPGAALPQNGTSTPPSGIAFDLPRIIALAIERNPLVAGALGAIDQSTGQRVTAGAYPNPTISGYSGRGLVKDAGVLAPGQAEHLTEYTGTIGQPLEWPSKRAARQRAADAGLAGATVALVETRLNLTADVKIAFYDLLLAQRDADLAKQNLEIIEGVRRIVNARVRLGESPQFEAIKAEVEVLKAKQTVTRADNTVRVTRVVLDTLTAGALGREYTIKGDFEVFMKDLDLRPLLQRALEEHPTVVRISRQVERAGHTVEFERQARIPNVTINGGYYREIGREALQAGISVPSPVWYRRQGEIAEALGVQRREEADLLRVRNTLFKEVNQYFQEAKTTADLIDVFEKGLLKQAEEALRIAQFSFRQGASSLLEVLDAQRVLRQILSDYARARFELSVALTRLERAVGTEL
jgi:cobalt-zinc-cadmium efflux system outer membrane protein